MKLTHIVIIVVVVVFIVVIVIVFAVGTDLIVHVILVLQHPPMDPKGKLIVVFYQEESPS